MLTYMILKCRFGELSLLQKRINQTFIVVLLITIIINLKKLE